MIHVPEEESNEKECIIPLAAGSEKYLQRICLKSPIHDISENFDSLIVLHHDSSISRISKSDWSVQGPYELGADKSEVFCCLIL